MGRASENMELITISSLEQLNQFREDWSFILEENQNTNPFIEFDWVYEWWRHLGRESNVEIITVLDNEEIIAFFPFMYDKKGWLYKYSFIGFGQANYMNFIGYDHSLGLAIEFVIDDIISKRKHVLFNMHGLLNSCATPGTLEAYLRKKNISFSTHCVITPFINLDKIQMDEYLKKRQRLHRLNRGEKKLLENADMEVLKIGAEKMDVIFQLHEKRWKKKHDTSGFTNQKEKNFFRSLTQLHGGPVNIELDGLYIDDKMIAFNYGFRCRERYVSYVLGFDDDFEIFSPGKILEKEKILQCSKKKNSIFDLSIGYEAYKFELNTDVDFTIKMIFSSRTLIARTARSVISMKERVIHRIKQNQKIVLYKRNKIGKMLFVLKNILKAEKSKEAWNEISSFLLKIKKFLFEWERYRIYEMPRKNGPEIENDSFVALSLKNAIQNDEIGKYHMKKICTKIYGAYKGYYKSNNLPFESVFWINERVIRINEISFLKNFKKRSVFIENWKPENLREICSFVKKQNKANTMFICVKENSKKKIIAVESLGFTIDERVFKRTIFGFSKTIIY